MESCLLVSIEDPLRNAASHPDDFWYSITDVGRAFHGDILSWGEYCRVEALYLETVMDILGDVAQLDFKVGWVEEGLRASSASNENARVISEITKFAVSGELVPSERFPLYLMANLRLYTWCPFDWPGGSRVRFLGDYVTAVSCPLNDVNYQVISPDGDIQSDYPSELRVRLGARHHYLTDIEDDEGPELVVVE